MERLKGSKERSKGAAVKVLDDEEVERLEAMKEEDEEEEPEGD